MTSDVGPARDRRAVHLRIAGRVQGVGFRNWMVGTASALRLAGWVRNRRDGSVEAVICGPAAVVDEMVALCRQGPRYAAVERVDVSADAGSYDAFEVRPTE